ncbi:hypothetical protein L7F22_022377 [Adiantum nelumboides]|nr:hypothetical protein [Adiantum nelumboides]
MEAMSMLDRDIQEQQVIFDIHIVVSRLFSHGLVVLDAAVASHHATKLAASQIWAKDEVTREISDVLHDLKHDNCVGKDNVTGQRFETTGDSKSNIEEKARDDKKTKDKEEGKVPIVVELAAKEIQDAANTKPNDATAKKGEEVPKGVESVSTIENLDKAKELKEEPIDFDLEKKERQNLDVALFRAKTVVDEPTEDVPVTETPLTLVHLPSFHLNRKDYITLHSIQSLFIIREDYCLAAIAEASQVAKDFVDIEGESKEEFLALDLETYNEKFLEAPDAFEFCLKRVVEEDPALKDANFEARLVNLGIDKFGRNVLEPDKINADLDAKVNLEHEEQIEANELQKIELLDEDNFLGRAGGLRVTSKYTGHTLIHYLPKLDKDIFCVLHSQFLDHSELPMFAIKTLSRFMGFLPLPNNVNRILVLKRAAAFRIFGYAPGFYGSRVGYFLCYSSYVISNKDTNVKLLAGYKRRKFLRYRGKLPETSATKRLKN